LLEAIGDLQQNIGALGGRRAAPCIGSGMRGVQRERDVFFT
jgi:hypothetical protein